MEIQDSHKIRGKIESGHLPTLAASASPPSSSSSPAHEFSFTISLHQPPPSTTKISNKAPTTAPPSAVDLSPADDIFFHGHLLPLHFLSHLPVSPRSSTNSLDSFTLPITELLLDGHDRIINKNSTTDYIENTNFEEELSEYNTSTTHESTKGRVKSKSFSIFGLPKWRKGCEKEDGEREKKKFKFDVSDALKKYMRMVRPLLSFRGSRRSMNKQFHRQPHSFSGSVSSRAKQDQFRGRRGLFSAPASMRTSPTNSGLLLATGALAAASPTDSTMEELQAAIQAAITHCKNSNAVEENIDCQNH